MCFVDLWFSVFVLCFFDFFRCLHQKTIGHQTRADPIHHLVSLSVYFSSGAFSLGADELELPQTRPVWDCGGTAFKFRPGLVPVFLGRQSSRSHGV